MPFELSKNLYSEPLESERVKKYAEENGFKFEDTPYGYGKTIGIYAIYAGKQLIYIGKSTNVWNRWLAHMRHIVLNKSDEDKEPKYDVMRTFMRVGIDITFTLLATLPNEKHIDEIEMALIEQNQPILNRLGKKQYGKI